MLIVACNVVVLGCVVALYRLVAGVRDPLDRRVYQSVCAWALPFLFIFYIQRIALVFAPSPVWVLFLERSLFVCAALALAVLFTGFHIAARAPLAPDLTHWWTATSHRRRLGLYVGWVVTALAPLASLVATPKTSVGPMVGVAYDLEVVVTVMLALVALLAWLLRVGFVIGGQLVLPVESRMRLRYVAFCTSLWAINEAVFGVLLIPHSPAWDEAGQVANALLFMSITMLIYAGTRPNRMVEAMDRFGGTYLMAAMEEALVAVDAQGYLRAVNAAAERLIGQDASRLVGRPASEALDPRLWVLGSLQPGGPLPAQGETILSSQLAEGAVRHAASRITALTDARGTQTGCVEILHDVTALKEAQQRLSEYSQALEALVEERSTALAESEARYRGLVEYLGDCLLIVQDGRIQFANPAAGTLLKRAYGTVVGLDVDRMWDTDLTSPWAEIRARLAEQPQQPWRGDMRWALGPLETRAFLVTASTAQWEGAPAILLVATDVTEQRSLQASLDHVRRLQALGTLTGGIAHDFNNFLTGIVGRLSLLEALDIPDERARTQIRYAIEAAAKAEQLVKRLLRFSRPGPGGREPTDLGVLLHETEPLLQSLLREEVRVEWELPSKPVYADVDSAGIQEILLNLAKNADDAMRGRSGSLHVSARSAVCHGAPVVQIRVSDTGPGILPEVRERLFEPFFTTKPPGEGHGLGLALAHQIMREHGGSIDVHSEPGNGATFTLTLPRCAPPVPKRVSGANGTHHHVNGSGHGEKILVVDDDPDVLQTTQDMLQRLGYAVRSAANGRLALDVLEREADIACLLLDVVMPDMNGIECASALEQRGIAIPIIFMTGYDPDPQRMRALAGAYPTLGKPFRLRELQDLVRDCLRARRREGSATRPAV